MRSINLMLVAALLAAPATASADRVARLCKVLVGDPCLQSQLRAIVALGRLQSPRSVPCIAPFLQSSSPSVRLVTARSLGQVGTPAAGAHLERRQDVERDTRVARKLNEAMARVTRRAAALAGAARAVITVRTLVNDTGKGEPELPLVLTEALVRELDMAPGWAVRHEGKEPAPRGGAAPGKARAMQIGGRVIQLTRSRQGAGVVYSCVIQLAVRDAAGVVPGTLRLQAQISTPFAGHYTALDSAFFSDLMEVAGRQAARRIMAAVPASRPRRSPTTTEGK